eukprot:4557192-Amphidinium_carterae.1
MTSLMDKRPRFLLVDMSLLARSDRLSAYCDRLITLFRAVCRHVPSAVFSLIGQDHAVWKAEATQSLIRELKLKFSHHAWCALTGRPYKRRYTAACNLLLSASVCPGCSAHCTEQDIHPQQSAGAARATAEKAAMSSFMQLLRLSAHRVSQCSTAHLAASPSAKMMPLGLAPLMKQRHREKSKRLNAILQKTAGSSLMQACRDGVQPDRTLLRQ